MSDEGVLGTCGFAEGVRHRLDGEAPAGRFQEEDRGLSPWLSLVMVAALRCPCCFTGLPGLEGGQDA